MVVGTDVDLSPGDFMLDGDPAPSQKGGGAASPIFGPFLLWPNGWMHQDATWYGDRPQPRGICVRWGPSPLPKKGAERPPQIFGPCLLRPNGCMDQDASGKKIGLDADDIVLDGDPAPPSPKREGGGAPSAIFGPCPLWPNGWMDQYGTWRGGGPWSTPHCARWGPSSPKKGTEPPPIFGPFLLWPNGWMHQDVTWY